jgi:hypothetical protein
MAQGNICHVSHAADIVDQTRSITIRRAKHGKQLSGVGILYGVQQS